MASDRPTGSPLSAIVVAGTHSRVAGVILNTVGSETHAGMIRDAVACAVPILGALPRAKDLVVPERHLGLHLPHEARTEYVEELATLIEAHIDLDALLRNSVIER